MTASGGGFRWDPARLREPSPAVVRAVLPDEVRAFRAVVDPAAAARGVADSAPTTFPARLQTLDVPGLCLPSAGVVHAAQEVAYPAGRLLAVGERVSVVGWLESVRRRGRLAIVVVVNQMRAWREDSAAGGAGRQDEAPLLVECRSTVMVTLPEEVHA